MDSFPGREGGGMLILFITKSSCFVCFRANIYKRYYNGRVQEKMYAPSNAHTIEYFSNG